MFGVQEVVVPELLLAHQVSFEYLSDVTVVSLHKLHHALPVAGAQRVYLFPNICIAKGDQLFSVGVVYLQRKLSRWAVIL